MEGVRSTFSLLEVLACESCRGGTFLPVYTAFSQTMSVQSRKLHILEADTHQLLTVSWVLSRRRALRGREACCVWRSPVLSRAAQNA